MNAPPALLNEFAAALSARGEGEAPAEPTSRWAREDARPPRNIRSDHGFTLIEIMVVVVIIGLLLTVVASNVTKRLQTAEHVKSQADIKGLETAVETYRLDNGLYPTTEQGLEALVRKPASEPIPQSWNGPYLKGQSGVPKDRWGNDYLYLQPGAHNPDSYDVWTRGQDGQDGGEGPNGDVGNWAPEPETQQTAAP